MKPLSLATRIHLGVVFPVLIVLALALLLTGWALSEHFFREEQRELNASSELILSRLEAEGIGGVSRDALPGSHHSIVYGIYGSAEGLPIKSGTSDAREVIGRMPLSPGGTFQVFGQHYVGRLIKDGLPAGISEIRLALNVHGRVVFMRYLRGWLIGTLLVLIVLIPLLAHVVIRRGFSRLRQMSTEVASTSSDNLSVRWVADQFPQEIRPLIGALNRMLERIEEDYLHLQQFSDAMAHELKTPLTSQIANMEVVLMRPRSDSEYREALSEALKDAKGLAAIVQDMLFISRTRALSRDARGCVDLEAVIHAQLGQVRTLLEARCMHVDMAISSPLLVRGNQMLLERAVANVVSNAIKYAEAGSPLKVTAQAHGKGEIEIVFGNRGQASAQFGTHAFERFWTDSASRTRRASDSSSGLGLAIVRAAIEAQSGRVKAEVNNGWIFIKWTLPVYHPPWWHV